MKERKGFTLLEMLIVIGIIAVLVGVMMMSFSGSSDSARAAQCLNNMRSLSNAVIAYGIATANYPPAGTYDYKATDKRGKRITLSPGNPSYDNNFQGWIGYGSGNSPVSPYYQGDDTAQYFAITNGTIWRYIRGGRDAYTCPAHVLAARKEGVTPAWSYVMNSYFGWRYGGKAATRTEDRIREFDQNLAFCYKGGRARESRSPSKTLLFAEMPFVVQKGVQDPKFATSASDAFDTVLQYGAKDEDNLDAEMSCAASGGSEAIGFNHRNGKHGDYMAHVAFADGHVEKIPLRGGESDIKKLTTILCVGRGYTLTPKGYEKAN